MCGIAGFTHLESTGERARIAEAVHAMTHRGPDESGTYESRLVISRRGASEDYRSGRRRSALPHGRRQSRDRLQWRGLQSRSVAQRTRGARCPLPVTVRHRGGAARFLAMGHGRLRPAARHVRVRRLDWKPIGAWCWCATGLESSRCTTTARDAICISARN